MFWVFKDGQYMAVGAVGSYYWQGQLIIRDTKDELNYYETEESNEKDLDNSYLGFSMALGEFDGDSVPDYAVGRPKWQLTGKVLLFTGETLQIPEDSIVGEQFGEYFGYSVVADDFNNDGFDDVAAGAPFYTDYSADAYENGRVYVFYQAPTHFFNETERTILSGNVKYNARFGLALGKIGDLNQDGYNDLAVGAPYDGPDGKGAVYIFHGSKKGILKKVSQIIFAADLKAGLSTFGYSLAGGYDMDRNLYPDIAVGAYESNQAVYLKSRPIVKVIVRQVLQPEMIDLTASDCQISSTVAVPCMNIETHISYEGKGTPRSIDLEVKWELDADSGRRPKRAFFYDYGTNTETRELTVDRDSPVRLLFRSYIKNDIRDKLTPIVVKVSYTLMDPVFIRPNALLPVLDQYTPQNVTSEAHIKKNCGDDNICIPDLTVTGSGEPRYHVFGKEEVLSLSVVIENLREDAFEAQAFIVIPEGVSYANVRNETAERPITCQPSEDEDDEQRLIICELGNPMTSGETISFIIDFGSDNMTASARSLDFHIHVNSTNEEDPEDLVNNQHLVQIPLKVETRIRLSGVSKPEQILYNYTFNNDVQTEEEAGPQVIHLYEVRTFGPSDIQELDLQIHWPIFLGNQDQHLLYLTEVPKVIQGQGECRASFVNLLNITIIPENTQVAKVEEIYEAFSQFRQRRDASEDKTTTVDCKKGLGSCTVIRCTLHNMRSWNQNKDNALIQIRSRLWTKTLIEVDFPSAGIVSSAVAQVMKTPYAVKPDVYPVDTVKVSTSTVPLRPYRSKEPIKVWVIAVSIAGGCILLLLLIALLWRCGFFKRHRPGIQKATLVKKGQNGHANGTTCEKYKYDSIANDHF